MFSTPILFLIFNRPEATSKVFAEIRKQKPQYLYIGADGPRGAVPEDVDLCKKCREIATAVDWDCEVKTLFREPNMGAKYAVSSAITWFFNQVEYGIILEDDCLPGSSFFPYCEELLLRYRDEDHIMHITGANLNDSVKYGDGSYYYSEYPNVWGWATWKRAWDKIDLELTDTDQYLALINKKFKYFSERLFWVSRMALCKSNQVDSWDYPWMFSIWKENGICLNSNYNLIENIGFGRESTHTKGNSIYITPEVRVIENIKHPLHTTINPKAETAFLYRLHGIKRQNIVGFYLRKYFIQRCINLRHKISLRIKNGF